MFCLCILSSIVSIDGLKRSSRGLCWLSWAALGAYVGGLGAYVGGPGPLLGLMLAAWAVLGRKVAQTQVGTRSGPVEAGP